MCSGTSGKSRAIAAAAILATLGAWPLSAQKRQHSEGPAFRADSTLVVVPVTVVNRRGATVNGLAPSAFSVTEDGVRQQIRSFSEEDAPVSLGIVLDLSGSMRSVLGTARESLRTLLDDANPDDEAFLSTVSSRPGISEGFSHDLSGVLTQIALAPAGGSTALVDTIFDSLRQLRSGVHSRKALVIISDGMDNHSRHSRAELLARVLESDAQIYTIGVEGEPLSTKALGMVESTQGLLLLQELAARTGGISCVVRSRTDIRPAASEIGRALRNQYTIGYVPRSSAPGGKWHKISVSIEGSGMKAYARSGYRLDQP